MNFLGNFIDAVLDALPIIVILFMLYLLITHA